MQAIKANMADKSKAKHFRLTLQSRAKLANPLEENPTWLKVHQEYNKI